jgi:hypothetical protein
MKLFVFVINDKYINQLGTFLRKYLGTILQTQNGVRGEEKTDAGKTCHFQVLEALSPRLISKALKIKT